MRKKQLTLLQIAELGRDPIGKKAKDVVNVKSKNIQELIDNMIATCREANGVGIAAPQVYHPLRLFIVASQPNPRYPNAPKMKPLAVANPKIISTSKQKVKDWEGCLSLPGLRGFIPRHKQINVEYTTREGKVVKKTFKDFVARIFQHEYDHIEGMVFVERVENPREFISEKEYQRLIRLKPRKKK